MFIKKCKSVKNGKPYFNYQIAHSYRQNGKVKHKLIANLGVLSDKNIDSLITGLQKIKNQPLPLEEAQRQCLQVLHFAELQILASLWDQLHISEIIRSFRPSLGKISFDLIPYLKLMTFYRFLHPGSELSLAIWFRDIYFPELSTLSYHRLLRSL